MIVPEEGVSPFSKKAPLINEPFHIVTINKDCYLLAVERANILNDCQLHRQPATEVVFLLNYI